LEHARTDISDTPVNQGWLLRSKHFVFGMPQLADRRHDYKPDGRDTQRPGISVLVREGFVIAHFDRMRAPLWVCQRWTKPDYYRMKGVTKQPRRWKEDLELPSYARAGTSYDGNQTKMDRGHMARHKDNHAWGVDSANMGCRMSNSTPQHKDVNRGKGWRDLEDAAQEIVKDEDSSIEVIWTISGSIYRDKENPPDETPEEDFAAVQRIGGGFGVPNATYKIVGWFDEDGHFQARGYVFEQTDRMRRVESYLTPIEVIEHRTGLDFFSLLKDDIEELIESTDHEDIWGAE
jgi:endonuclease G